MKGEGESRDFKIKKKRKRIGGRWSYVDVTVGG
jgi:hypothetical protein